jgi:5-methylcytosine-specific restriction endonuclease McrA
MSPTMFRKCARCQALHTTAGSWCPPCAKAKREEYDRARAGDPLRKFYASSAWKRFRAAFRAAHPTCALCRRPGQHVDHILSVRDHPARALDPANVRTLCESCHNSRTARTQSWHRA